MMLNALCSLYDIIAKDETSGISREGYSAAACSYVIVLSKTGEYKGLITLGEGKEKKTLVVPEQKPRSGKTPPPYFLCDNAKYLLGFEYDKKAKKLVPAKERLASAYSYYTEIAETGKDEGISAVLSFLKNRLDDKPLPIDPEEKIYQSGNIVFKLDGEDNFIHERPGVKTLWEKYNSVCSEEEITGQCLITGEKNQPIARLHHKIKADRTDMGGSPLVSVNSGEMPSANSYGKTQCFNSPVSKEAEFKYTTALNYLISHKESKIRIGNVTVVFWTENHTAKEQNLLLAALGLPISEEITTRDTKAEEEIADILKKVRQGKKINDPGFKAKTYVLGLEPNKARLCVRFWYENTLENFIQKTGDHAENLRLINADKYGAEHISIYSILTATVPTAVKNADDAIPSTYEQRLFNSILLGSPYPMSLYTNMLLRLRCEAGSNIDDVEKGENLWKNKKKFCVRTSFIKAVLKRNFHNEDITVSLNENSTETAYNLGRLFAVIEGLQRKAIDVTTIRSRYFASASMNPKIVYPSLMKLTQYYVEKLSKDPASKGIGIYYDKMIGDITSKISEFPANLSLEDQGKFVLGYYHQRESIYTKKTDENENKE